jgi:hypothetical protein
MSRLGIDAWGSLGGLWTNRNTQRCVTKQHSHRLYDSWQKATSFQANNHKKSTDCDNERATENRRENRSGFVDMADNTAAFALFILQQC